jgi:hypothetical protein
MVENSKSDKYLADISKINAREGYMLISKNNENIIAAQILEKNGDTFWIREEDKDMTHKYSITYDELTEIFDGIRPKLNRLIQIERNL